MISYLAVFLLLAGSVFAADSTSYVLVLLNANPERPDIEKDSMERVQVGHLENMNRLYNEGILVVSGPFGDKQGGGLFLFKVPTLEEARAHLATDPAVQAQRYAPEVFLL